MADDKVAEEAPHITEKDALELHSIGRPGKIEIRLTKALTTQRDLSLAYSPGVAAPCLRIADDPNSVYDYTAKGNMVAVVSNGTAVLGLGNLGALASKPVMEGKAVLFKRFADVDAIDLCVDTEDVDEFVAAVRHLGPSFGGINLEDISAPACFIIEQKLKEVMDIPIFHDDQHGTAITAVAGLINALDLSGRSIQDIKVVINGAGAAAIACVELMKAMGLPDDHAILCDRRGVIYQDRGAGMNQWKSRHAVPTDARTLADAMKGADVFMGLSVAGAVDSDMVKSMARQPIVFAMANPEPEIRPERVLEVRSDAIVATGRSDYPNQINNVLGFPYIFRGTLDARACTINEPMKIAAAEAIAKLAREDVPDEVEAAYPGRRLRYGPGYIIPVPFDPRLIVDIPPAIAQAAMDTGVARKPIEDKEAYRLELRSRQDPAATTIHMLFEKARARPKRIVFAEGEEEKVIRAAIMFRNGGYGTPILIGRQEVIEKTVETMGLGDVKGIEFHNAFHSRYNQQYTDFLYNHLQRRGHLRRDCQRLVNRDRNVFAACMVAQGDADGLVTGITRSFAVAVEQISLVLDPKPGHVLCAMVMIPTNSRRTVFMADTNVNDLPQAEMLADIACQTAAKVRQIGHIPRVAFLSYSSFGHPDTPFTQPLRDAVTLLENRPDVGFEFDGEMQLDVAINPELMAVYPFSRLSGPANVFIMPGLHSSNISAKMLRELGGLTVIGPILIGLEKPAQVVRMGATVNDLVLAAAFAAIEARE